jgi:hypothetical protein
MRHFFAAHKTVVFIIVGVVLALLAAWWSLSGSAPSDGVLTAQGAETVAPGSQDIVSTLLQLRTVSLSGTIFSDPSFSTLRDFGTQIVPEPVGRPNPFAPFSSRSVNPATNSSTSTQPSAPR